MSKDSKDISVKDLTIRLTEDAGRYYVSCKPLGIISERILAGNFQKAKRLSYESVLHSISESSRHAKVKRDLVQIVRSLP